MTLDFLCYASLELRKQRTDSFSATFFTSNPSWVNFFSQFLDQFDSWEYLMRGK